MARQDVTNGAAVQCVVERQDGPAGNARDGADAQDPQEVGAGDLHGGWGRNPLRGRDPAEAKKNPLRCDTGGGKVRLTIRTPAVRGRAQQRRRPRERGRGTKKSSCGRDSLVDGQKGRRTDRCQGRRFAMPGPLVPAQQLTKAGETPAGNHHSSAACVALKASAATPPPRSSATK